MFSFSYWEKTQLLADIDVCIIGSGIVGLSTAIYLKKFAPTMRVIVLERGLLPAGASTRNAGFACYGSISELLADMDEQGPEQVFELVAQRFEGLLRLRRLLGDARIDYEALGGYEIFTDAEAASFEACQRQLPYFNEQLQAITGLNTTYSLLTQKKIQDFGLGKVKNIIHNGGEGQLNTGKLMAGLLEMARELDIEIWNNAEICYFEEVDKHVHLQLSANISLNCQQLIVCTNGFARQLLPGLDVNPARNQVWVTAPIADLKIKGSFHYQEGYYYFRNIEGRVLLGGGRHLDKENETTTQLGESEVIQQGLRKVLTEVILPKHIPQIDYKWSGIMGVGSEKKPILSFVSKRVLVAVRMGGMGVAIGNQIGENAAKMCLGRDISPTA